MRRCACVLALLAAVAPARGADLRRIDRHVAREPAYKSTAPSYGLLVFGPAAATRVWVVLDGTDLYVDTNGNGDLTEAGKRFPGDGRDFKPFTIADRAGPDRYRITGLGVHRPEQEKRVFVMVSVEIVGKYRQYCDLTPAPRRLEAPVAHFHGPLVIGLREYNWVCHQKLVRGDKPRDLDALVGTFDRASGCWVVVSNTQIDRPDHKRQDFPPGLHPVAEVEFPPGRPGGEPIRRRYELKERC
jgi:hypothetical protein